MRFTGHFRIHRLQAELDFVDIPIDTDVRLFIDPFSLVRDPDEWSKECHRLVAEFFQLVLDKVRASDRDGALELLSELGEPNETHLGYSVGESKGKGAGKDRAQTIYDLLANSPAFKTGKITDFQIEDTAIVIPGIDKDIVSDMVTDLIYENLVRYTQDQCAQYGITCDTEYERPIWDQSTCRWVKKTFQLPSVNDKPILLVPRAIVQPNLSIDAEGFDRYSLGQMVDAAGTGDTRALKDLEKLLQTELPRKEQGELKKGEIKDRALKGRDRKHMALKFAQKDPSAIPSYKRDRRRDSAVLSAERVEARQDDEKPQDLMSIARNLNPKIGKLLVGARVAKRPFAADVYGAVNAILYPYLRMGRRDKNALTKHASTLVYANAGKDGLLYAYRTNEGEGLLPNVLVDVVSHKITAKLLKDLNLDERMEITDSGLAIIVGVSMDTQLRKQRPKLRRSRKLLLSTDELAEVVEVASVGDREGALEMFWAIGQQ